MVGLARAAHRVPRRRTQQNFCALELGVAICVVAQKAAGDRRRLRTCPLQGVSGTIRDGVALRTQVPSLGTPEKPSVDRAAKCRRLSHESRAEEPNFRSVAASPPAEGSMAEVLVRLGHRPRWRGPRNRAGKRPPLRRLLRNGKLLTWKYARPYGSARASVRYGIV